MSVREEDIPMSWKKFLMLVAICKAAIGGAGAALAVLGAFDFAAAITAHDWLASIQNAYTIDAFAAGGGVIGAVLKIVARS